MLPWEVSDSPVVVMQYGDNDGDEDFEEDDEYDDENDEDEDDDEYEEESGDYEAELRPSGRRVSWE